MPANGQVNKGQMGCQEIKARISSRVVSNKRGPVGFQDKVAGGALYLRGNEEEKKIVGLVLERGWKILRH